MWLPHGNSLRASWKSHDPESGVHKTEFCVGTVSVGCQVKSMTEIHPNSTGITCDDCQLSHQGSYYVTLRVTNGAGLFTLATTYEVKVDLTAPLVGNVIPLTDVTPCVINCTLVANITSFEDKESGIKLCSYAIRNSSNFINDFVNNGLDEIAKANGLQLVAGERYYVVVRCENNAGLVTEKASSIAVLVDDTPPTKVKLCYRAGILIILL